MLLCLSVHLSICAFFFKFADQNSIKIFYADHKILKNNSADPQVEKNFIGTSLLLKHYVNASNILEFKMLPTTDWTFLFKFDEF